MICGHCRHDNVAGSRFCSGCGQPLVAGPAAPGPRPSPSTHLAERVRSLGVTEGERKQVTVLFADLKGSMELLADRDPEEARGCWTPCSSA